MAEPEAKYIGFPILYFSIIRGVIRNSTTLLSLMTADPSSHGSSKSVLSMCIGKGIGVQT
ncbi:hypothetical protein SO802_014273, partial [Lithocarpus litseifolius]